MLRLDRGPLAELIMTEVGLQGLADLRGELPVGLLRRAREADTFQLGRLRTGGSVLPRGAIRDRFRAPLRPWPVSPEDPLQRHADQTTVLRLGHDELGHVRREL